jgi:hypothetical protein
MTTIDNIDERQLPIIYEDDEIPIFVIRGEILIYESFEETTIEDPEDQIVDDFMAWRFRGDGRQLTEEELNW